VTRPGAGGSGGDCFDALANALLDPAALPGLGNPESTDVVQDLAAELRDNPEAVALRVRDALGNAAREWKMQRAIYLQAKEEKSRSTGTTTIPGLTSPARKAPELPKARLALVVDQLEELFTSGFSSDIQQKYVSTIAGLVYSGRVFVLATLRSDFYSSYQQFSELTDLARPGGKVDLRPPTAYEIGNMIRLPAEAAGVEFERDHKSGQRLDEGLRDAASMTPESLPLLQHVLSLLYDKQHERGDGLLRWSDYRELGELKGALAKYAEAIFATLQPNEQLAFPLVMRHLVTLGQGEEEAPNRRTAPYREFVAGDGENEKSGPKGFVDLFIAKRLFIADTDPHGEVNVSVAHEALLREWQRIREWLTENRDFLRMRDRLDSSLKLWLSRGKQKDDLLGPGLPLAEGEKLLNDFEPSLSQGQTDYVRASVAEQKRQHRIRERVRYGVMAAISVALIVATIFGVVSYRQYRRAQHAKIAADQAAKRANLARNEAQKLINFMTVDLRDKLKPIGRLDLLDDVNQRVRSYYDRLARSDDNTEIMIQRSVAMANYGDILQARGDLAGALKSLREGVYIQEQLVKRNPNNADWQRNLATSLEMIGDVLKLQGNIEGALEKYRASLPIREKIAQADPSNVQFQLDWSVILERIGEVLNLQGDVDGALENYEKSLPIRQRIAVEDRNNSALQLSLSQSYTGIGDMLGIQGHWDDALRYYQSALQIRQNLVAASPGNARIKDDLSNCLAEIGYAFSSKGELKAALEAYRKSLAIIEALSAHDPTHTGWKRDHSISLERVGDVLKAQGQYSEALKDYQDALSIRQELVKRDATNLVWQSDVSWSHQEIGDVLMDNKDFQNALENYQDSLAIAQRLAEKQPANDEWQSDLAIICEKTGEALAALGNSTEALKKFRESLTIAETLAKADPKNAERAANEASALFQVGMTLTRSDGSSPTEIRTILTRARDILLELKQKSALDAQNQNRLDQIQTALGNH
jgi:tetratricopeptide (TPR) repeat protein